MFRIFRGASGNSLWLIKDGFYYQYKRLFFNVFIITSKFESYEN